MMTKTQKFFGLSSVAILVALSAGQANAQTRYIQQDTYLPYVGLNMGVLGDPAMLEAHAPDLFLHRRGNSKASTNVHAGDLPPLALTPVQKKDISPKIVTGDSGKLVLREPPKKIYPVVAPKRKPVLTRAQIIEKTAETVTVPVQEEKFEVAALAPATIQREMPLSAREVKAVTQNPAVPLPDFAKLQKTIVDEAPKGLEQIVASLPSASDVTGAEQLVDREKVGLSLMKIDGNDGYRLSFEGGVTPRNMSPEMKETLGMVAQRMIAQPDAKIQILSYANVAQNDAGQARRLSLSRALAVRTYLMNNGVRTTSMDVRALGAGSAIGGQDHDPTAPLNRVDVVFTR